MKEKLRLFIVMKNQVKILNILNNKSTQEKSNTYITYKVNLTIILKHYIILCCVFSPVSSYTQ